MCLYFVSFTQQSEVNAYFLAQNVPIDFLCDSGGMYILRHIKLRRGFGLKLAFKGIR